MSGGAVGGVGGLGGGFGSLFSGGSFGLPNISKLFSGLGPGKADRDEAEARKIATTRGRERTRARRRTILSPETDEAPEVLRPTTLGGGPQPGGLI